MGDTRRPPAVPIPNPVTAGRAKLYRGFEASFRPCFFMPQVVENLMSDNDIILDLTAWDKGRLLFRNQAIYKRLEAVC